MDSFTSTTESYERWRERRIQIVEADLELKRVKLGQSPFLLARGSYYRYFTEFPRLLGELAAAPRAVSVGDLHVENFGTWRDRDARLVWGALDLDEVDLLPYPLDLVRLASTAVLAIDAGLLSADPDEACDAIEQGWRERVHERRPKPFVLGERHPHLYRIVREGLLDPVRFERCILALPPFERALPKPAARMLAAVTPPGDFRPQLRRRVVGVGSLGARRIVAFGELDGGLVVREAKQVPGPVSMWAEPKRTQVSGLCAAVDASRGTSAELYRRQSRKWILRPLAPDSTRLELPALKREHDALTLVRSMGAEAANIHLVSAPGSAAAKVIRRDDAARGEGWLRAAAATVVAASQADHDTWCNFLTDVGHGRSG